MLELFSCEGKFQQNFVLVGKFIRQLGERRNRFRPFFFGQKLSACCQIFNQPAATLLLFDDGSGVGEEVFYLLRGGIADDEIRQESLSFLWAVSRQHFLSSRQAFGQPPLAFTSFDCRANRLEQSRGFIVVWGMLQT